MRRLVMRLSLAVGSLIFSIAANAALVSYSVTGSWDGMQTWNPGQIGANTLSTTANGGPEMAVSGVVTFDDATGVVSYIELMQVGTLTSNWDLNPDYPNTPEYDTVTMSDYHWKSAGSEMRLLTGTSVCNGAVNADCGPGMQYGGNYMGRGGPLENFGYLVALTDWVGADNYYAYGDTLDGPGFAGTVDVNNLLDPFAINTLTSWVGGFVPLAAAGEYNLLLGSQVPTIVPVPAAVWLFGSALGLLGLRRRHLTRS